MVLAGAPLLTAVRAATLDPTRGMSPHQKRAQRRRLQQQRATQLRRRRVRRLSVTLSVAWSPTAPRDFWPVQRVVH